jgi:DNA polymerase elongation subunit (family B)
MCIQEAESYKATAAHVELSKKMAKRDLATAPAVGDRVAFVIIKVCECVTLRIPSARRARACSTDD